jgi:hypothetical protein
MPLQSPVSDMTILGDRLYLLDAIQNLQIYSLEDPLAPTLIGAIVVPERYLHLTATESAIYVARTNGVQVVDVADPRNPVLGSVVAEEQPYPLLAVSSGRLAVVSRFCTADCAVQVYDLADPLEPTLLAGSELAPPFDTVSGLVGVHGQFALARASHGVSVYAFFNETVWLPIMSNRLRGLTPAASTP